MHDFFIYRIGEAQFDLDNAPYGGARFPVSSLIDGRLFVRFQIDIGLDVVVNKVDRVKGSDWLDFCDIPSPVMAMITEEQQFAEKIHAYTLPRGGRMNSRVKDLVDLLLLLEGKDTNFAAYSEALETIFKVRKTHKLPVRLPNPPMQWESLFQKMAEECGITLSLNEAYEKAHHFFQKLKI